MQNTPQSLWVLERIVVGGCTRLHEGVTTIGRASTCGITIPSDFVSRKHAEFQVAPDSTDIQINDLHSTNGIFVNDVLYKGAACRLKVGDRIGIGVFVEDDQVTPDGKYPMFILRSSPLVDGNNIVKEKMPAQEEIVEIPPSPTPLDVEVRPQDKCVASDTSDEEYDEDDDKDDFVQPKTHRISEERNCKTDPDIENIVPANIQSIFGDLDPELLRNLSKDTREIVEANISKPTVVRTNDDDVICISSDDECDGSQQRTVKSPELFGDSFNSDDASANLEKQNEVEVVENAENLPISHTTTNGKDTLTTPLKVDDVDANEEEEMYFTQKLLDEFKEELPDSDNEVASNYKVNEGGSLAMSTVNQKELLKSGSDFVNLDDDDDEYDEDLETKVKDWSFKLFSQSFSNSFNASQVYEDDLDRASTANTEGIFINIDDDEDQATDGEQDVDMDAQVVDESIKRANSHTVTSENDQNEPKKISEDVADTSVKRQWKKCSSTKFLFSSFSSEEGHDEEVEPLAPKEPSSSSRKHAHARKLSSTDEIPQKKPRLNSKSEGSETENTTAAQHSSPSLKTYSRKSSDQRDSRNSKRHTVENESDVFDKLREQQSRPSHSVHEHAEKHSKSKDTSDVSKVFRRSSSAADATPSKTYSYMSATIARRKSLGNHSFEEKKDIKDDVEIKKPEQAPTTKAKMIRGPPEIITPPLMTVGRGKLRGFSAVQMRCVESIKEMQGQIDLKRKWKEKPSIAKRKEQANCKAIKEDRKQRLKELADKKNSDAVNTNNNTNNRESDHDCAIKVKNTNSNRGAFLTEPTPSIRMKSFKIPKASTKLASSSSTLSDSKTAAKPPCSITTTTKPTSTKATDEQKSSTEVVTSFSMELSKADAVFQNNLKQSTSTACRERQKSTELPGDQRERAPPRRSNKKLTFDAMEEHFVQTSRLQSMQDMFAKASSMKSLIAKPNKKKTVRFNDVPEIRYIEPVLSATRKVDKKEPSTFNERRAIIRRRFPIVDHTDDWLSQMLGWSQRWLQNKRTDSNRDGSDDMVFPMTNQFTSINNYKDTVFPLLKIEYLSDLERHMQRYAGKAGLNIRIDYSTPSRDREILFAKCTKSIRQSELGISDLALIEVVAGSETSQYFGYINSIRKADSCNVITIEVSQNLIPKNIMKSATKLTIRRIIEGIRVHFGAFNAVHQVEQTPLFQKILNPLELLKVKTYYRPSMQYKGCDALNAEQTEVLLKTYAKTIDEFNSSITLIQGPPGTGKSRLITNLALQLLYGNEVRTLDKKILICAQSNMAVDVIAQQLHAIQKKLSKRAQKYSVIRFGKDDKMHRDVRDITLRRLIESDHRSRLQKINGSLEGSTIKENLQNEILKLEAKVAALQNEKLQDVRQDELIEMKKSLALKKSIQNQTLRPDDEKRLHAFYLENANIICTTLCSCVKLSQFVNYFDVCIIDEATQCIEPWTIMPLKFGVNSLILVGDTQQLPATVISQRAKDYGLGMSLFTRIQNSLESNDHGESSSILSLRTQYRMHPEICKWPNMYFYKNQLLNDPITAEFKSQIKPFSILNLEYRQNDQCYNGQIANSLEAEFVVKLAKTLNLYIPNKFFSYGVITPYAQHREKLEAMLKGSDLNNIMINTIDSYQGIEKDVVIISNARTQGIGFLANYQRLNVALTRPKKCLILCGNFKNLESVPSWASLLATAKERGLYHDISIADAGDIEKNVIEKIKIKR